MCVGEIIELLQNGETKKHGCWKRNYRVTTVAQAKRICSDWLNNIGLRKIISFGLPEINDRYHIWKIALLGDDAIGSGRLSLSQRPLSLIPEGLQKRSRLKKDC